MKNRDKTQCLNGHPFDPDEITAVLEHQVEAEGAAAEGKLEKEEDN